MLPTAYVVHRTRQRVRLRVPEKRGDPDWFGLAASALERLEWIDRVEPSVLSSSLILHCAATDCLDQDLSQTGVFEFQAQAPASPTAVEQVQIGLSRIEGFLQRSGAGVNDLRSLMFLLILALAGLQMVRGRILVPAISLLWYAMELVLNARGRAQADPPEEPRETDRT